MQIETYEIEEVNSSEAASMAADSEAIELIEKLGLTGQKGLVNTDTATRFIYPVMTNLQVLVYGACFPQKCSIESFAHEVIPVRVLQVAAFCRDFPQTKYLEVWHTAIPKKDPVLVGRETSYSGRNYLLARWGDSLESFEALTAKAQALLRIQWENRIRKIEAHANDLRQNMDNYIATALSGGEHPEFHVYA